MCQCQCLPKLTERNGLAQILFVVGAVIVVLVVGVVLGQEIARLVDADHANRARRGLLSFQSGDAWNDIFIDIMSTYRVVNEVDTHNLCKYLTAKLPVSTSASRTYHLSFN